MTSMQSFHSFFWQQLKQYIWIMVIALYLCCTYVMEFAMAQKGILLFNADDRLGPQNSTVYYITIILAVLCAIQGFGMLFSEKKTAFYLSLPISRNGLFFQQYLCGCAVGLFPCVLSRVLCFALAGQQRERTEYLLGMGIAVSIVGFLFIYHLVILILMLTGKIAAAVIGTLFAAVYGNELIGAVIEKYSSTFFASYYRSDIAESVKTFLSPVKLYENLTGMNEFTSYETWDFADKKVYFLVLLALMAAGLLADVLFFRRRPAECAGRTLAFSRSRGILKALIAIPISLLIGYLIMHSFGKDRSLVLLLLGITGGAFAMNGLLEILYQADAKKLLSKKRQGMMIAAAGILTAGSFYLDLWNYDTYIPMENKIETVAVSVKGIENTAAIDTGDDQDDITKYRLEFMKLKHADKKNALSWIGKLQKRAAIKGGGEHPLTYVVAGFQKKNGNVSYRRYPIYDMNQLDGFEKIFSSDAYRSSAVPLYAEETAGELRFTWTNGAETCQLDYNKEETQQLLDCYRTDVKEQGIADLKDHLSIGALTLNRWGSGSGITGYLYPSYHRTISFLTQRGIPADKTLKDYEISRIEIEDEEGATTTVTKPEKIADIKPELLFTQLAVNPAFIRTSQEQIRVEYKLPRQRTFGIAECLRIE